MRAESRQPLHRDGPVQASQALRRGPQFQQLAGDLVAHQPGVQLGEHPHPIPCSFQSRFNRLLIQRFYHQQAHAPVDHFGDPAPVGVWPFHQGEGHLALELFGDAHHFPVPSYQHRFDLRAGCQCRIQEHTEQCWRGRWAETRRGRP
ncbi:MAG TPA: hypothetical protein VJ436_07295 [Anaerolineales bacterium]|nr:hypothetical protein [Anaerolineales bacterium]